MVGKPHLAAYDMILKGVQIDRGHVVMTGDSPDKNIAGPSRTGRKFLFGDEVWVCTSRRGNIYRVGLRRFLHVKPKLGFVGLGNIGEPICRNLLKVGYEVAVHDMSPEAVARL